MSFLKLNQKAVELSTTTKRKQITVPFDREGKFDNEQVVLITAQNNSGRLPKGASQNLLKAKKGDGIIIVPNYIDANYTKENLAADLPADVLALIPTYTGGEILANIEAGIFNSNLSEEDRATTIAELAKELIEDEVYCVPSFIFKRNLKPISLEEYNQIDAAIKKAAQEGDVETVAELRTYKAKFYQKGAKVSVANSIADDGGQFTTQAWAELGGDNNIYGDEAFTTILSKEEAVNTTEKFSKYVKYSIYPTPLTENNGEEYFLIHSKEEYSTISKAGTKGSEKRAVKNTNVDNDIDIEDTDLEAEL